MGQKQKTAGPILVRSRQEIGRGIAKRERQRWLRGRPGYEPWDDNDDDASDTPRHLLHDVFLYLSRDVGE
jgi:hypothetical protein